MELMFAGGRQGERDWTTYFVEGIFPTVGTPYIKTSGFTHGVNLAEGLRYPTVLYRITQNDSLLTQTSDAVNWTTLYHSSRAGSITADEHLGGMGPQRGSETCMVVEMMFSMSYLYRFYGIGDYADKAERAAYNALSATVTSKWWAHQYVQQTNQPWSRNLTAKPYYNVVSYVNHGQGYPKFTASSYVRQGDSKIIHALLGPTTLKSTLNDLDVTIACTTAYPFSGKLTYTITAATYFEFAVRIPSWATANSSYRINNGKAVHLSPDLERLQKFQIHKEETQVQVDLDMAIHVGDARNGSVAIYYGPLLYALDIEYNASYHSLQNFSSLTTLSSDQITTQTHDWVLDPSSEWRYGVDPTSLTVEELYDPDQTLPSPIRTRENTPVALWVNAWQIDWTDTLGTAALPPVKPAMTGEPIQVRLIAYGAGKLHIAEFPVVSIVD